MYNKSKAIQKKQLKGSSTDRSVLSYLKELQFTGNVFKQVCVIKNGGIIVATGSARKLIDCSGDFRFKNVVKVSEKNSLYLFI